MQHQSMGHFDVATLLIERGAEVDSRNRDGWTPLLTASLHGQLEVARLLLDHGADVNTRQRYQMTPLHVASYRGDFEMVQLLLERGADANVRGVDGLTPREVARQYRNHRIAEILSGLEEHDQITVEVGFLFQLTFDSYRITDITTVTVKGAWSNSECSGLQ